MPLVTPPWPQAVHVRRGFTQGLGKGVSPQHVKAQILSERERERGRGRGRRPQAQDTAKRKKDEEEEEEGGQEGRGEGMGGRDEHVRDLVLASNLLSEAEHKTCAHPRA